MAGNDLDTLVLKYLSITPGTPMYNRERNQLYGQITEILIRDCAIHMQNEADATAYADAMRSVMKNYSPDTGDFLHYFRKTYFWRKRGYYSKQRFVKSHIRTKRTDIGVYDAPKDDAKPLRLLHPNCDYYVYTVIPEPDHPEYFKLRLSIPNDTQKTRTVYVKNESGVEYYRYDTERLTYVNENGKEAEKAIPYKKPSTGGVVLTREMIQRGLRRNLLAFLKFHEKKTIGGKNPIRQGKLTKYDCFRMFFTEDMITILQNSDNGFRPETTDSETMSMNLCDLQWIEYLLTQPCHCFHQIIVTPRHTYDHFLHNGKDEPIMFPPILSIRGKYIREIMGVDRTDYSMKAGLSEKRSEYNAMRNALKG